MPIIHTDKPYYNETGTLRRRVAKNGPKEDEIVKNRDFQLAPSVVEELNAFLTDPANPLIGDLLRVVAKYGSAEEINARAREAGRVESLMKRLERLNSPYLRDL